MNIALVAHDGRKKELLEWVRYNAEKLFNHRLYVSARGMYVSLDLYEYGKDWALTIEELEQ